MQPVPGIQIVGTTQREIGGKNRVGRGKKGDSMKQFLSPSPSKLSYWTQDSTVNVWIAPPLPPQIKNSLNI